MIFMCLAILCPEKSNISNFHAKGNKMKIAQNSPRVGKTFSLLFAKDFLIAIINSLPKIHSISPYTK